MAGVYFILGQAEDSRLSKVAGYLRNRDEFEHHFSGQVSYVWLGFDDETKYSPAVDPATGVRVVTGGRTVWSCSDWVRGAALPFEGGVANRLILDRYLQGGTEAVSPFNGAAAILVWDPRDHSVHLWTDQLGYHPAFLYQAEEPARCVFTTFPDAVLADPGVSVTLDHVSMAEFLRAWRVTPPHTYYREIKHAGAATHWQWNLNAGKATSRTYWEPFRGSFFASFSDASHTLAAAVGEAIKERTAAVDSAVCFVSGGADSRTLLYAANDPAKITGINLFERRTREADIAEALCTRRGVRYIGHQRDNDYYPRMLMNNVRWSGAMWSAEDSHYFGVQDIVRQTNAQLVMTACTTDWVFKGYGLEKTYQKFLGRNLPLKKFLNQRVDGFLPNYPSEPPAEFAEAVRARMEKWFAGTPKTLKSDKDRLLVEDRRIRPACYTVSVSGQMMYRVFPYDTFLADSRIAECYSKIPARWKLNGEAWGQAASLVCEDAKDIVDANFGWALDAGQVQKLVRFGINWAGRRWSKMNASANQTPDDGHPPSNASWPELGWYAIHSNTLRDFWQSVPDDHRDRMRCVLGEDPWGKPLEAWLEDSARLFRILTLLSHWRNQEQVITYHSSCPNR